MSSIDSPIPLADIESVLAWIDTFKLSRPTKKINRDFSDAVLLAEILNVYYPKLVEMHNYPPRNSHSLKLNNWMTLNRKVLKKLKLNLCNNTMEQLANCAPGIIERVLVMVRDKIRRDEDLNKSMKEGEQNMSSGGSYYEACGEDENILVVPVKVRVNGVLEVIQKKVVSHESYLAVKEEMKDARDSADLLKQKVEHLDNLLKLKDERIEELQKQLERKQSRRKEVEILQNSLSVPFDEPPSPNVNDLVANKLLPLKSVESLPKLSKEESRIPIPIIDLTKSISKPSIIEGTSKDCIENDIIERVKSNLFKENSLSVPFDEPPSPNVNDLVANKLLPLKSVESLPKLPKEESRIPIPIIDLTKSISKPSITEVTSKDCIENDIIERVKSNLFKEIIDKTNTEGFYDTQELVNEGEKIETIETTIQKEIKEICEYKCAPNMLI